MLEIYKVPAFDRLTVNRDYKIFNISNYSISGSLMSRSKNNKQNIFEIDMAKHQSGLYLLHIKTQVR